MGLSVQELSAKLLPEIERSVVDTCCCSRAETAPPGDHGPPSTFAETDWAEFAGLFAPGHGPADSSPLQQDGVSSSITGTEHGSTVVENTTAAAAMVVDAKKFHVAPPRPYDDWLRSCSDDGSARAPWRQPKGSHNRSEASTAPPMLGKLGKLVLPPVSTETSVVARLPAAVTAAVGVSANAASSNWNFKSGARPTAVRTLFVFTVLCCPAVRFHSDRASSSSRLCVCMPV